MNLAAGREPVSAGNRRYIYALGYRWLDRLYDPLIRVTMADRRFKAQLIARAGISGQTVALDVGCGTGTLLAMLDSHGAIQSVGLDGDGKILAIAREKRGRAHARFELVVGHSTTMPFASDRFDRAFCTLMLHHLDDAAKLETLAEVWRVLRDGGELHIADWGRPHTPLMRAAAKLVSAFDGRHVTRANLEGRIPDFCRQVGFSQVELWAERSTPFGTLAFCRASKAAARL